MINLQKLNKTYFLKNTNVVALNAINLHIHEGDFIAIMGESGSGKSTLLNILGILDKPTAGTFLFEDSDISKLTEPEAARFRRQKVGFVFQNFNLLPKLSVSNNVQMPLLLKGISKNTARSYADLVLEKVGLINRKNHKPNELSGGQQQRVAIARSLINDPKIIIADEPTGNLDSETSKNILELFGQLNKEGKTIIMVTHSETSAKYANRVIQLKDGNII
ncbi:MAG: macrolide ABC transporter ATP-binding protein [Candidatus Margulisbacteria bacterium GWF2_35_9]|nr:MAG: macrolide ABC transporter ATP-binding protein [Candidatus Margulisbacteria bacterium GWF2_35_9]